jgi:hypothetical protein
MMKKKSLVFFDEVFHKRMSGSGIKQDHILPCFIGNDVMPVDGYGFAFGGAGENMLGSGD